MLHSSDSDLTPKQFEQLLCEFCKQDLPPNFTVEHNIKDIGSESGNERQIDTKIKGRLGISDILICGEAKNWNKEVGSEVIDGLVGKYLSREISANKVIVFSNRGYSMPAIIRAKNVGIELLEPKEIGKPIQQIPHIIATGYLGKMIVKATHESPQHNLMALNPNDYIILKGDQKISFQQNIFRHIILKLKQISNKNIYLDLSKIKIEDKNVLYELKQKEGFRYHASFEVEVELKWYYYIEDLPMGILHHLNTGEIKFVNLQGSSEDILKKVLLSPTKDSYEEKEKCIERVLEKNTFNSIYMCVADPDRENSHPNEPFFFFI